jgi:hypothetical protein
VSLQQSDQQVLDEFIAPLAKPTPLA